MLEDLSVMDKQCASQLCALIILNMSNRSKKPSIKRYFDRRYVGRSIVLQMFDLIFFFFFVSQISSYLKSEGWGFMEVFRLPPPESVSATPFVSTRWESTHRPLSLVEFHKWFVVGEGKHLEAVWRASKSKHDKRWFKFCCAQEPHLSVFQPWEKDHTNALVSTHASLYVVGHAKRYCNFRCLPEDIGVEILE